MAENNSGFIPIRDLVKQGSTQGASSSGFVPIRELVKQQNTQGANTSAFIPTRELVKMQNGSKSQTSVDYSNSPMIRPENINADYINDYFTDAGKFLQGTVQDQQIGHWDYMTNPFTVKERDQKLQELTAKAQKVRQWFEQNRDYMDEEEYGKYITYLDALDQDMTSARDYYGSLGNYASQEEYKAAVKRYDWQQQYMDPELLTQAQQLEQLQQNGGSQAMINDISKNIQSRAANVDLSKVTERMKELSSSITIAKGKGEDPTVLEREYEDLAQYYSWITNNKYVGQYGNMSYADLQSAIDTQERFIANSRNLDESVWAKNNTTLQKEQEKLAWLKQYAETQKTGQDHIRENEAAITEMKELLSAYNMATNVDFDSTKLGQLNREIQEKYGVSPSADPEEWLKTQIWSLEQANRYNYLSDNADFEEKSKYNKGIAQNDLVYNFINNKSGEKTSGGSLAKYREMDAHEVSTYNYLYATQGKSSAQEYLKALDPFLSVSLQESWSKEVQDAVNEAPVLGLLSAPADFINGIPVGLEYIGKYAVNKGKELFTGEYQGPVTLSANAIRSGTLGSELSSATVNYIQEKYPKLHFQYDPDKHGQAAAFFDGHGLSDAYQLTNTGIQIGLQTLTGKFIMGMGGSAKLASGLTALITSGSSYTSTVIDAKVRGASDDQAMALGMSAGLFEWLFEKCEISELLSQTNKSVLASTLKNALSEGVGESATTLANTLADTIIMQDKSQFNAMVQQYVDQGMSPEEAEKTAWISLAANVTWDGLMGAISGGFAGGAKGVYNSVQKNISAKALFGDHVPSIVDQVLAQDPENKLALDIKEKLDKGKTVSGAQISKLVQANPKTVAQVLRNGTAAKAGTAPEVTQQPTATPVADTSVSSAQAFTGQSGTTWNQQQAALLAAIPDDVLKKAESWIGKSWPLFDRLDMGKNTEAQQAWKRAGLTWEQLGFTYIKVEALKDEIARRKTAPIQQPVVEATQPAALTEEAAQTIAWAKEAYESGNMTKEDYDGIVAAAQQYTQPAQQQPTAGTNTPQTVIQQPTSGTNAPQTGTQSSEPVATQPAFVASNRKGTVRATDILVRPTTEQWNMAQRIAEVTGRDIVLFRQEPGEHGIHDGYEDNGVLYINVLSPNPMAAIFGHECCHSFENTEEHDSLKSLVINWIERKGSMEKLRREKRNFYRQNGVKFTHDANGSQKVDNEIVAAYVGRNLFTNEQSIRDVVEYDPSIGQRIMRWIDGILGAFGNNAAAERNFLHKAKLLYQKALSNLNSGKVKVKTAPTSDTSTADITAERQRIQQEYAAGQMDDAAYDEAMAALDEEELLQEGRTEIPSKKKTAAQTSDNGKKHSYSVASIGSKQITQADVTAQYQMVVDRVLNMQTTKQDHVIIGYTPDVYISLGMPSLPFVIGTGHIYSVAKTEAEARLEGNYRKGINYHGLGVNAVKNIYDALKDPVMIIASKDVDKNSTPMRSTHSVVAIVDVGNSQESLLLPVAITAERSVNGVRMDVNALSSAYNKTVTNLVDEAIAQENVGDVGVYYAKKEAMTLPGAGVQFPIQLQRSIASDGIVHRFSEKVNMNISDATQSQQFKRWFGDWQNKPQKASKIVNADGTPKIMYHGSRARFTIFDKSKAKSSGLYGKGFYFTDSSSNAGLYGEQYSVYLNIRNPLQPDGSTVSRDQVRSFIEAIAENEDYSIENYGTYDVDAILDIVMDQESNADAFQVIQDLNATAIGNMVEGVELFNQVNGTSFDGIVVPTETVAFYPEQIKSATDNIGTFDGADPDINHSFSPVPEAEDGGAQTEDVPDVEISRENLPTKARNYLTAAENALRSDIEKALSVPKGASREYLKPIIQQLSDEYLRTGTISQETIDRLFNEAYDQGVVEDREYYDQYKHIKDHLRTTAITISQQDQPDIADFDDFRRRSRGILRITNEGGLPVDSAYQELQSMAPELFPERITHPADQLQKMYEVAKSIEVIERSLDEAHPNDAADFKAWAKNDFDRAVWDSAGKLRDVKRYALDRMADHDTQPITTPEQAVEAWAKLKDARRTADRAMAKNLLTESDQQKVGQLLRGEITLDMLDPAQDNVKGITAVYEAKQEYEAISKLLAAYRRSIKARYRSLAEGFLQNVKDWEDKKSGLRYARETMWRNIQDIVPDPELAKEINEEYFFAVNRAEAQATKLKNEYRDRVRGLNLSRKVADGNLVSEAHAVQLYGEAIDNIRILEKSRGRLNVRDGKTLAEWRAVVQNLWAENPKLDRAKIEKSVEEFRKIYDELFQMMNEVRVRNGYEPVNYRSGYFPHFQPGEEGVIAQFGKVFGIEQVDVLPTTINGLTHMFRPGTQWFGNAQERIGFNTAYDALEGFDKYIEGIAGVIHQTDNIQKLRAFASQIRYMGSKEGIQKQVDEVYADTRLTDEEKDAKIAAIYEKAEYAAAKFVVELDEYTNLLANKKSRLDRTVEGLFDRKFYNFVRKWYSRVAANMVGGNLGSALTNLIPLTQAWGRISSGNMLKGMAGTLKAYRVGDGIDGMSDFLTNRHGSDPVVRNWIQATSNALGKPMEIVDNFVSGSIVRAAYYQNKAKGMSDAEAIHQADLLATSIMADRSKGAMPTLFSSLNPVFKNFTQFQLEVNNQLSEVVKDIPRAYRDRTKWALVGAYSKYFIGAFLFNALFEVLLGRKPALDPIDMLFGVVEDIGEEKELAEILKGFGTDVLESLPFTSGLSLFGVEVDNGRIPVSSSIPDLLGIIEGVTEGNWADVWGEVQKPLIYSVSPFGGGGQLSKSWKGVAAFIKGGSYTKDADGNDILQYPVYKDSPGDFIGNMARSALFGKYSTPESQEWVDSGFQSLSAKDTAMYQDLLDADVTDREAYGIIKELRGVVGQGQTDAEKSKDKKAKQLKIIKDLDMSGDARAILYYGVLATEKECELMDQLADVGSDAEHIVDLMISMKGVEKDKQKWNVLLESDIDTDGKKVVVGSILGTDMETETGNPSQYAKFLDMLDRGMTVNAYLDFRSQDGDAEKYLKFADAGLHPDLCDDLSIAIGKLEPEEGKKQVSDQQKWRTVIQTVDDQEQQMAALQALMTDSQYAKLSVAYENQVSPELWVVMREILPKYDEDENGRYSGDEIKYAINGLAGDMGSRIMAECLGMEIANRYRTIDQKQKAVLWQLLSSSKSGDSNPFNKYTGNKVQKAYDDLRESQKEE